MIFNKIKELGVTPSSNDLNDIISSLNIVKDKSVVINISCSNRGDYSDLFLSINGNIVKREYPRHKSYNEGCNFSYTVNFSDI